MSKVKTIFEIEQERALKANFGNGISIASGFDLGAKSPLDSRLTVKTIEERNAHVTGNRAYEGMLVYVEADTKTYQLINNAWVEFGFNEEKFEAGIAPLKEKDTVLEGRIHTLEGLVVGGEGEGLQAVIEDVATNKADIAKLKTESATKVELTAVDTALKAADTALAGRIDGVESDLAQAIVDVKADSATKATEALNSAKTYTDTEVGKVNTVVTGLTGKVTAVEEDVVALQTEAGLVEGKITVAKEAAIKAAGDYTDAEIVKVNAATESKITAAVVESKAYTDQACETVGVETDGKISALGGRLEGVISGVEGTLTGKINQVEGELTNKITANTTEISGIKDILANKNNNTVVVNEITEIVEANPNPKVGDMAYVISIKKAYIYKGESAELPLALPTPPLGWVLFDEITTEIDLVDYLKKADAEKAYRKVADKLVEADLHTNLAGKLNAKADKTYVDGELAKKTNEAYVNAKVEEVVAPVRTESAENKANIAKEVSDRKGEITRVEGLVSGVSDSLVEKETALKAEDTKITNRFNKFVPVVGNVQPEGTEAGHVWLEIL